MSFRVIDDVTTVSESDTLKEAVAKAQEAQAAKKGVYRIANESVTAAKLLETGSLLLKPEFIKDFCS